MTAPFEITLAPLDSRKPISTMLGLSVALHVGGVATWLYLHRISQQAPSRVISDVEIIVRAPAPRVAALKAPAKPSTWNFLKLALPSVPKTQAPLEVKAPEELKRKLIDLPKRLDESKSRMAKQLETLDLDRRRANLAAMAAAPLQARTARALAEPPKLEEVGRRRASKEILEMAQVAEERRGRLAVVQELSTAVDSRQARASAAQPLALEQEVAAPSRKGMLDKMAGLLAGDTPLREPQAGPALPRKLEPVQLPDLPVQRSAALTEKRKAVEIEGPLSKRKVTAYELPQFPAWLAVRGVAEAEVRIRFLVNPGGEVLPSMRVEQTSGFGALDRLAMESLKRWRFEGLAGATGNQWGIITFRFILE
ncbi:MAG: TonB family protein [Elusimicrobia bacterium]|nr:TonB family protein [Elusimicrobiota bacterium]